MPENVKIIDAKKFMWDGAVYETADKAAEIETGYKKQLFETRIVADGGKYLVYTRRLAEQQTAVPGS